MHRQLAALRGLPREAWGLELLDRNGNARAAEISAQRGQVTEGPLAAGHSPSAGELRGLRAVSAKQRGPKRIRNAALLAVMYGCGLRRGCAVAMLHIPNVA